VVSSILVSSRACILLANNPGKLGQTALNFIKRGIKVDSAARKSEAQAMIDQVCNLIF